MVSFWKLKKYSRSCRKANSEVSQASNSSLAAAPLLNRAMPNNIFRLAVLNFYHTQHSPPRTLNVNATFTSLPSFCVASTPRNAFLVYCWKCTFSSSRCVRFHVFAVFFIDTRGRFLQIKQPLPSNILQRLAVAVPTIRGATSWTTSAENLTPAPKSLTSWNPNWTRFAILWMKELNSKKVIFRWYYLCVWRLRNLPRTLVCTERLCIISGQPLADNIVFEVSCQTSNIASGSSPGNFSPWRLTSAVPGLCGIIKVCFVCNCFCFDVFHPISFPGVFLTPYHLKMANDELQTLNRSSGTLCNKLSELFSLSSSANVTSDEAYLIQSPLISDVTKARCHVINACKEADEPTSGCANVSVRISWLERLKTFFTGCA